MSASSPCINICEIGAGGQHCTGCWRTLDEIAGWAQMPEARRLAIMAELPAREARLSSPPSHPV